MLKGKFEVRRSGNADTDILDQAANWRLSGLSCRGFDCSMLFVVVSHYCLKLSVYGLQDRIGGLPGCIERRRSHFIKSRLVRTAVLGGASGHWSIGLARAEKPLFTRAGASIRVWQSARIIDLIFSVAE